VTTYDRRATCRICGALNTKAAGDEREPKPGDGTICIECGALSIFTENDCRAPTRAEREALLQQYPGIASAILWIKDHRVNEEDVIIICVRVADLPAPPVLSRIEQCGDCQQRVWVSDSSPLIPGARYRCNRCFEPQVDDEVYVTMQTLRECFDYFNSDNPEEFKHEPHDD